MTVKQEQQIKVMRLSGYGYKTIAIAVGISRDRVRYFCSTNNLAVITDNAALNKIILSKKFCKQCGVHLTQKPKIKTKIFCSEDCCKTWWKENRHMKKQNERAIYTIVCCNCGKEFKSYGNKTRKYCSHSCYTNYKKNINIGVPKL
jgi:hypothetical protein